MKQKRFSITLSELVDILKPYFPKDAKSDMIRAAAQAIITFWEMREEGYL